MSVVSSADCVVVVEWVATVSGKYAAEQWMFNPLKPKLVQIIFKDSGRTSKRTPHFTITKINWLTLFKFKQQVQLWDPLLHNYNMRS
jgi:hypothetical protein